MQCFKSLVHLKYLEFELLSCEIGDMEVAAFLYSLCLIQQLKYFCFKVIQTSPISMDYIEKFVEKISSMSNIKEFDLYFRKQYISQRDRPRIERMFSRFKNVQCSCSSQSLYIFKTTS